jgi:putative sterol carrier protein
MAVKFLSDDWARALSDALNDDQAFASAIDGVSLTLGYKVTDAPEGEVEYHMQISDGAAAVRLTPADAADVSITSGHETAIALQRGELQPQVAFMTGKIKVAGNLALLMMHQGVLSAFGSVGQRVEVEF